MKKKPKLRGEQAARLRQRKFALLRRYQLPEAVVAELLPGSLSQSRRRCGKPTCHCATGAGHPSWYLAFMVEGKQRVQHIPAAWAADVQRRVAAGREFKQAIADASAAVEVPLWAVALDGVLPRAGRWPGPAPDSGGGAGVGARAGPGAAGVQLSRCRSFGALARPAGV